MKRVRVSELIPGMITAEDVFNYNGKMVLPKGLVLTDKVITKLEFYSILSIRVEDEVGDVTAAEAPAAPPVAPDHPRRSDIVKSTPEFKKFKQEYDATVDAFKDTINNLIDKNTPVDTKDLLKETMELLSSANGTYSAMDMLHNMRQYDDLTFAHSMNVSLICNVFGHWLKWSEEEIELLTLCGLLHDLGKLKIPDSIIKKPDKLTDQEYNIVKTHTVEGYHLLKNHNMNIHIVNSALMHHEKCDGSGYPLGLEASKIDKYAKIVAIADVYDAMTSARIYRGPLCPFRVIELFESEGIQKYDTLFIMTFLENVVITYLNNDVLLSDGRVGEVVFMNKNNLSKPIVRVGSDMVDLSREHDIHIDQIL